MQRELLRHRASGMRDAHEQYHAGGYIKLYPCEDKAYYDIFIRGA